MTNGYAYMATSSVLTERFPYNISSPRSYGIQSSPHWHDFTQILYVVEGSFTCIINGVRYFCPAGSVIILYPYAIHKIDLSETNPDNFRAIQIEMRENPKGFSPLTYEMGVFDEKLISGFVILSSEKKEQADSIYKNILAEYEKKQNMRIRNITELISKLIALCAENVSSQIPQRELKNAKKRAEEIKLATDFIKEHCRNNLTAFKVSEILKISKSGFMTKFKSVTGLTFNEYFGRVRAYEALSILRYSTKSVAEVAEKFGYSSSARFVHSCTRLFKKSPLQIKKDWMKYDKEHGAELHKIDMDEQVWKNVWNEEEVYVRTANAEVKY